MPDDPGRSDREADGTSAEPEAGAEPRERTERGLSDLVKRAMSAGLEVAARSKDDFVRVATSEVRSWLNRLDFEKELVKALNDTVVEVKAEIRFRTREDGSVAPEVASEVKTRPGKD